MWLLESDGDVFRGKRLWLPPGKKFVFGRTTAETGGFAINNKTISRKHLLVEVGNIHSGDGARREVRSQIVLEDLNTKIGTLVNGEQIKGQKKPLHTHDIFEVKLGHHEELFRFLWVPVVLTFSFTGKELKNSPLLAICESLEIHDIKVDILYSSATTHVVAKKRNTSKGLQALINGKYIVDHTFVDAIIAGAKHEEDRPSLLEVDFDANWPQPLDYLPPRGAEPSERLPESYGPNPARQDIFEGYTFIFYDRPQFDNLQPPITNGKGKALLHEVEPETTEVNDFVRYVKDVAGESGLNEFEDGSEGRGVVIVKFVPIKGSTIEWYQLFIRDVSLRLDQRAIEQSEFLDAILNNDASVLRRALETEAPASEEIVEIAPTVDKTEPILSNATSQTLQLDPSGRREQDEGGHTTGLPPPVRRGGRTRRVITSRFKGFDDANETPLSAVTDGVDRALSPAISNDQPQGNLFVSQSQEIPEQDDEHMESESQTRTSTKRPRSSTIPASDMEDEVMDQLAPAAAQLKRRRLENEQARRDRGEASPAPIGDTVVEREIKSEKLGMSKKKKQPEIDVLEHARRQREKAEELARQERESLQINMEGMDIDQIRNLAIIEEMPVGRSHPPRRAEEERNTDSRWNDNWNGRKNFKRFRKRGTAENAHRREKVIVQLEEVKKKDFGIGDEYWLDSHEMTSQDRAKQGLRGKTVSRAEKGRPHESRSHAASNRSQSQNQAQPLEINVPSDDEDMPEVHDMEAAPSSEVQPASTLRSGTIIAITGSQSTSTQSKRPVSTAASATNGPPTKKARPTAAPATRQSRSANVHDEDDDSDDGLAFKFRRRT